MSDLRTATLADFDLELATTRRVLERVPTHQLDWKPHERSMTLGGLATHITNLLHWWQVTLFSDGLDMAGKPPALTRPTTTDGILELWDHNAEALQARLTDITDDELMTD